MMKQLIFLCGKKQSGKNTLGSILEQKLKEKNLTVGFDSLAQDLKDFCAEDFYDFSKVLNHQIDTILAEVNVMYSSHWTDRGGSRLSHINDQLNRLKLIPDNFYEKKTALSRSLLTTYGTGIVRKRFEKELGNDYWLARLIPRALNFKEDVYIITDCRWPFVIERFWREFNSYGNIKASSIMVERHNPIKDSHESENGFVDWNNFTYIVDNNGSLNDLNDSVDLIVKDLYEDQ